MELETTETKKTRPGKHGVSLAHVGVIRFEANLSGAVCFLVLHSCPCPAAVPHTVVLLLCGFRVFSVHAQANADHLLHSWTQSPVGYLINAPVCVCVRVSTLANHKPVICVRAAFLQWCSSLREPLRVCMHTRLNLNLIFHKFAAFQRARLQLRR